MKSLLRLAPLALMLALLMFSSCDLVTVPPPQGTSRPADHVVINELFTLPESNQHAYSWLEIYNPTSNRIEGLNHWTLSWTAHTSFEGRDTTVRFAMRLGGFGLGAIPDTLEPGNFLVLIGDSISFYNHTNLGPGKGTATRYLDFGGGVFVSGGGQGRAINFFLQEQDEIVLRDTSFNVVDVVRYGGYVPPSPDPYPGNKSAGAIPEWSSLCRYAGAYSSGNSANDFYMEAKPIPLWYSQLNHP
jgi:hypothetical protein